MRIRSIKPEYWRSADITNLDIADRFLFIGLWSYVDDSGSGIDDEATIIGDLFARDMFRDPRETVARVSRGLLNLFEAGLIIRYTSSGKSFLHITNWEKHQRIDKPGRQRYPRPDDENVILATSSRDSRDTLAPGTGEQGSRGTGEQGAEEQLSSSDADASDPDAIWTDGVKELCDLLAEKVRENGHTVNTVGKTWWQACERLIRIDGYTVEQIAWMIRWCTADEFWSANIRSMSKMREKFSQMKAQATRGKKPSTSRPSPSDRIAAILAIGEQGEIES